MLAASSLIPFQSEEEFKRRLPPGWHVQSLSFVIGTWSGYPHGIEVKLVYIPATPIDDGRMHRLEVHIYFRREPDWVEFFSFLDHAVQLTIAMGGEVKIDLDYPGWNMSVAGTWREP